MLGLRSLQHASDLAPFASQLHMHLAASALLPRAAEIDTPLLELLVGVEFLTVREAEAALAPYWLDDDGMHREAGDSVLNFAGRGVKFPKGVSKSPIFAQTNSLPPL